ncbi:GNAT family N-acetyltransferase [Cellulomonas fengjieae]|uniref:GNAT family N-acetyltransferase n=1 Tax=Cellulomonas fengjieae TaxID=2819978 RepID=UPI001AAEFE5D|nr:GNAT family N-acetyltransferase [Cellulomonas fengjieae]MBO3101310.1 GNAT family N-acetyltransferase [Cellulomonas fengjieae]
MSLRWTYLDTPDVVAWSELTNLLATVDRTEEFYAPEDLAEELEEQDFDRVRDSIAVWDGDRLVGYGQLRLSAALTAEGYVRANLDGGVHPQWRARGIGTELMDRMEPRARALSAQRHPGAPLQLRSSGRLEGDPVRPMLEHRGYSVVRYFTEMARPLPGTPIAATDPRVEPYRPDLADAVRLAHNDAFATHWGSTAQTVEQWTHMVTSRSFRPETSRIVRDGDVVLAYVLTAQWVPRELYVSLVGTRQSARGGGLARACLAGTVAAAAASGDYDVVELEVDSVNPTGAGEMYASLGFVETRTTATYAKVEQLD